MKGRKVRSIHTHVGVNFPGSGVQTSISREKQKGAELELTPAGVYVSWKGHEKIVPFANIHEINLVSEEDEQKAAAPAK